MDVKYVYPSNMPFKSKWFHVIDVKSCEVRVVPSYSDSYITVTYIDLTFIKGKSYYNICRHGEPMGINSANIKHLKWKYPR